MRSEKLTGAGDKHPVSADTTLFAKEGKEAVPAGRGCPFIKYFKNMLQFAPHCDIIFSTRRNRPRFNTTGGYNGKYQIGKKED